MAEKRMFSKNIVDSDAFLDMPLSAQALYFHLCMRADDDGFINNPKRIQTYIGAGNDDFKLLLAKKYVIAFESGVVVIKHWFVNNTLRKDRYKPTTYIEEKMRLCIKKNKVYTEKNENDNESPRELPLEADGDGVYGDGCQMVAKWLPQDSIDKNSIEEIREEKDSIGYDETLKSLVSFYEQNIAPISSIVFEHINGWLGNVDSDLIVFAIEEAAIRNKRSWKYIEAILKEKFAKGIKIGAEARREKEAYENESGSGKDNTDGFGNIGTHI